MGASEAQLFIDEGARVVISDVLDSVGQETAKRLSPDGSKCVFLHHDVTSEDDWNAVVASVLETYGQIDILVNNAGIFERGSVLDTTLSAFSRTMDINVKGVLLGCKYAIPTMLEQGKGSIINVASFVAHMGAATPQVAYTASKGAVLAMTREIAVIYARKGIRANALCPGPVMTPLLAAFLSDDAKRNRRLVHIPMGRFGEPTEIAHGALFLASDESSWMTGQSLIIDGGITAAYVTPE